MGEADIQRDLGGLEADMKTVKTQVNTMFMQMNDMASKEQVKELTEKIDRMAICMATARGGYRALIAVGAVAGATGGFIVKVLPFIGIMR